MCLNVETPRAHSNTAMAFAVTIATLLFLRCSLNVNSPIEDQLRSQLISVNRPLPTVHSTAPQTTDLNLYLLVVALSSLGEFSRG